jgi:SAM-dependent methyltransferase
MVALRRGDAGTFWREAARSLIYRAPEERDTCPACGSARLGQLDLLPLRRQRNGLYVGFVTVCHECGLVFSNPLPSADDLKQFYSPGGAWRADAAGAVEAVEPSPRGLSWSKPFDPIRNDLHVTKPPKGAKVLDFGCGGGKLLDAFQDFGWTTAGIEPASDVAFQRHSRLDTIPDEPAFDLIVANHVLEHVADPLGLLRQFARACKVGGFVFISVPRFDTLPGHRDYSYVINGRAHITAYTWTCLRGLLLRAGFEPASEPPVRVAKGRGKTTTSRLRILARRVDGASTLPQAPASAARNAITQYHATLEGRSLLERLGFYRLAARQVDARRKRAIRTRKSEKITT